MTIQLPCAACGQPVEIESMLFAGDKVCPHCGRYVLGGRAPSSSATFQAPTPPPTPAPAERPRSRGSETNDAALKALAITNFCFGGLHLCCGSGLVWAFDYVQGPEVTNILRQERGLKAEQIMRLREAAPYAIFVYGILLVLGVTTMATGYGLVKRDPFTRWLNLGLVGVFALIGVWDFVTKLNCCSLFFYGSYSAFAAIVLLNTAHEFRPPPSAE